MVALNHAESSSAIDEDILYEVAAARARGRSWETAAAAVQWNVAELRRTLRDNPHFATILERARQEVDDEAQAEGLQRLRLLLRDEKSDIALQAAEVIARYTAEKRRDETLLAIEKLRAETRLAVETLRAEGRATRIAERAAAREAKEAMKKKPADELQLTPEEEQRFLDGEREYQTRIAAEAAKLGVTVYLWSGKHRLGNTPPDASDAPLRIFKDTDALVGGRPVYWAIPIPCPTDPIVGPFLRE